MRLSKIVATVPTACGMRRRVRGSRGAKRRWGPHISSPWLKGRENEKDGVTVPTACGMRRRVRGSRGAKRRWGPHISSPWPKRRENEKDRVKVPTDCGMNRKIYNSRIIFLQQLHMSLTKKPRHCRGFFVPSFSDYLIFPRPSIMNSTKDVVLIGGVLWVFLCYWWYLRYLLIFQIQIDRRVLWKIFVKN